MGASWLRTLQQDLLTPAQAVLGGVAGTGIEAVPPACHHPARWKGEAGARSWLSRAMLNQLPSSLHFFDPLFCLVAYPAGCIARNVQGGRTMDPGVVPGTLAR